MSNREKRIIVGITGASGAAYGVRMLEVLREAGIKTHLVVSKAAHITIPEETGMKVADVQKLADVSHPIGDIAANISSGSFKTMGMIIAPCSVKSLAEIATGISSNLLTRAADVILKERRRLVLMVRETPFHLAHLRHMVTLSEMGAVIAPPLPAFYNKPESVNDVINHSVGRVLDLFDIDNDIVKRWEGNKNKDNFVVKFG